MRRFLLVFAALPLLVSTEAEAHGRFPEAGQVVVDPADAARLYVRTTYGILTTRDAGESWYWICPDAVGFDADIEDPALVATSNGALIVGTFDGLALGTQDGCQFDFAPGDIEGRNVKDVQLRSDPSLAVAMTSNCKADLSCEVHLFEISDGGASVSALGQPPPSDFLALTLGLSASDPDRIYLTGKNQPPLPEEGVLMRSDDGGQSYTRLAIPGTHPDALPYLGGVDPSDPDRLYVGRVETDEADSSKVLSFALLVSDDGGASFQTAFESAASFPAFSLSPDGVRVAIGSPEAGLWIAEAATLAFAKVSDVHVRCLTWDAAGLYACTDQFLDGYNLGLSTDGGKTFTPSSEVASLCGPPPWCAATTSVGAECPGRWVQEKAELGAPGCGDASEPPVTPPPPADDCACQSPGAPTGSGLWAALALGLAVWRRRG